MRNRERPLIQELPLIGVGIVVATVAASAAGALLWTARGVLHLAGLDRPVAGHA